MVSHYILALFLIIIAGSYAAGLQSNDFGFNDITTYDKVECGDGQLSVKFERLDEICENEERSIDYEYFVPSGQSLNMKSPTVTLPRAKDVQTSYTILMYDPDAPSRETPVAAPWLHWAVVNIPSSVIGSSFNVTSFDQRQVIMDYAPPTPPPKTSIHRYFVVVYVQPGYLNVDKINVSDRKKFPVDSFVTDWKLKGEAGIIFTTANREQ
ncbi:unnamed protein product [Clavelina lepadiformis]|uniref:Phosphatidylethanolamine-binding protein n=1 Tax=Clavelina lepadiformis TaxID=159417 RepID=A0ABP0FRA5_CLALP